MHALLDSISLLTPSVLRILTKFRVLSQPCSVIRSVTIDVINRLDAAGQEGSSDHRLVFSKPLMYDPFQIP